MLDNITTALADICVAFGDRRLYCAKVGAAGLDHDRCTLRGAVLDQATLDRIVDLLEQRFPAIAFDAGGVEVYLRAAPRLTVTTTLTGLHAGPSFLSELLSQLLNGWELEVVRIDEKEPRWCMVRQADGYLGWAYVPYLAAVSTPAITHLVCEPVSLLRTLPEPDAPLVTRILGGTGVAAAQEGDWTQVTLAGGASGWAPAADLRAAAGMPAAGSLRRRRIVLDAQRYTGVPYLWGGCSALGIDCSGFAQLLHRLIGITLPRDADMQCEAGRPVDPPFQPGDLLFFGEGDRRSITHVGVSLGGWRIIHSSRSRNGVHEDDVQAVAGLRDSFAGARTFIAE